MKNTSVRFLLLFLLLVIIGLAGFQWYRVSEVSGYPEPLPVSAFMERPLQFSGNQYHLDASVENVLASEEQVGRIVLVSADLDGSSLPIFLPSDLPGNVEFQQKYRFKLSVENGGLLYVHAMTKN
ncbi:hypothetical protein [Puniceicoccus vermicola]|uniref:Uncharacterized protein n=1 Tax=Puniceicoccus vermicola TaxID=388746 RepID=A0A7X1E5Z0_9BACT|nr:hypothetical protein [Puniceicoccus vermicola]MBC2602107.1 hypothetical protein [Puniceicoccus vermicola]